jgi:proprotein convertase subtilisin/kexin type 5
MGTTSVLLFERPRDVVSSNFDDWPFLSVHYWGEKADGRWTLQVINAGNRHVNQPGVLSVGSLLKLLTKMLYFYFIFCEWTNP